MNTVKLDFAVELKPFDHLAADKKLCVQDPYDLSAVIFFRDCISDIHADILCLKTVFVNYL